MPKMLQETSSKDKLYDTKFPIMSPGYIFYLCV